MIGPLIALGGNVNDFCGLSATLLYQIPNKMTFCMLIMYDSAHISSGLRV